jgi:hypothetical protein
MVNSGLTYGDAFVTEVTVDFEHTFEAAHNQTLQIQFRRDTQVHIHIQRVVMGDERTGRRAAGDHLHHRGFDFHKAAATMNWRIVARICERTLNVRRDSSLAIRSR